MAKPYRPTRKAEPCGCGDSQGFGPLLGWPEFAGHPAPVEPDNRRIEKPITKLDLNRFHEVMKLPVS
jgi:hypothetical protein